MGFDATPIIPSLKIRGNKIYASAQEDDKVVRTADFSPVKNGETADTVSNWYNQAIQMGLEYNIHVIGVEADGDSKFRKFYLQT